MASWSFINRISCLGAIPSFANTKASPLLLRGSRTTGHPLLLLLFLRRCRRALGKSTLANSVPHSIGRGLTQVTARIVGMVNIGEHQDECFC